MYVCVCNAIREDELRHAARRVDGGAEAVYEAIGCQVQCGTCLDEAEDMIVEERACCRKPRLVAA
jgi:bacterioferritin-associated ferredoxin